MTVLLTLPVVAELATALGALIAGWQLWLVNRQAVTQFEDSMSGQYREIIRRLPIEALLGKTLSDDAHEKALSVFFHYFDLCNEQAFLRRKRRIRASTWREWEDGIRDNLRRPAFDRAWREIGAQTAESFEDLRSVLDGRRTIPSSSIDPRVRKLA